MGTYLDEHVFHLGMFIFVLPIAGFAFLQGFTHHHNIWVMVWGIPGLLLLAAGIFLPEDHSSHEFHIFLTILGSLLLVIGHYTNWRTCRKHRH